MRPTVFLYLFTATHAFGQVVVDDGDNLPIADVQVSNRSGIVLTSSDKHGRIALHALGKNDTHDTLIISHLSYETLKVAGVSLNGTDTIRLSKREYPLTEVSVQSEKRYKFKKFSACYRTYQSVNGGLILYSDGNIDYATESKREKYLLKRKNYRAFKDTSYFQSRPTYSIDIVSEAITTPRLPEHLLPQEYFSRKNRSIVVTGDNGAELIDDGIVVGHIKRDSTTLTYLFDGVVKPRERRMFGFRLLAVRHMVKLVFRINDAANVDYSSMKLEDLIYFSHHSIMKVKHKSEKEFKLLEEIQEGFIDNVISTDSLDMEEYTMKSGVGEVSNYSHDFWLECDCEMYYPPTKIPYQSLSQEPNVQAFPE